MQKQAPFGRYVCSDGVAHLMYGYRWYVLCDVHDVVLMQDTMDAEDAAWKVHDVVLMQGDVHDV